MPDLYEPCPLCGGRGSPGTCPACRKSGFVPTGLKSGQAERLARLETVIRGRIWHHAAELNRLESGAIDPDATGPERRALDRERLAAVLAELKTILELSGYTRLF